VGPPIGAAIHQERDPGLYLNKMYMGAGTYGVEAASKYYFGHSAGRSLSPRPLSWSSSSQAPRYNPLDNPNVAGSAAGDP
jgi:penicillin-binding protein 1A